MHLAGFIISSNNKGTLRIVVSDETSKKRCKDAVYLFPNTETRTLFWFYVCRVCVIGLYVYSQFSVYEDSHYEITAMRTSTVNPIPSARRMFRRKKNLIPPKSNEQIQCPEFI